MSGVYYKTRHMADNVIKLKLDSGEYEGKIKRAAQGIQALGSQLKGAGKTFADADKEQIKFVQELGKMETVSRDVRGRVNELNTAFVNLTSQYNRLSDAEKQAAGGQALAKSLDQIKQRAISARQEMEQLNKELQDKPGVDVSGAGGKIGGALSVFAGNMYTKAAEAAMSFAGEIKDCISEGIELARQGEGIRIAFERLGRGEILQGLREATHGTVTDIELMKAAVKFNDFQLPLEELGTMLAFAQQKAKDTGQSVDFMVESIVTGLGRKSLMILDNLGLSASEIKEKMAETGDMTKAVGQIIREQMAKAGEYVETAADKAAQANVSLQNKMEELGRKFSPVEEASNQLWTSMKIAILDVVGGPLAKLLNSLTEAGRMKNMLDKMNGVGGGEKPTKVQEQLNNLKTLKASGISDNAIKAAANFRIQSYDRQIAAIQKEIDATNESLKTNVGGVYASKGIRESLDGLIAQRDALKVMRDEYKKGAAELTAPIKVDVDADNATQDVESLKLKLIELEAQRKKAVEAGDDELSKDLLKQINQVKSNLKALDPTFGRTTKNTAAEKTETQLNDEQVKKLTKEYQDMADVAKKAEGDELSAAQARMNAIREEIKALQDRNEELRTWEQIAQGKYEGSLKLTPLQGVSAFVPKLADPIKQATEGGKALRQKLEVEVKEDNVKFDTATLQTLVKDSIKNGISDAWMDMSFDTLGAEIARGIDVPDETWQKILDQYNELREQIGLEPININLGTGKIKEAGKDAKTATKDFGQAASAISSVGSALQSIEDPSAKVMGIVAQAIGTVAMSFASALGSDNTTKGNIWAFIGAAAASTAAMIAMISQIHGATGYAQGGIVKGTSYSGDNILGMVGGTTPVGLDAGELVLTRAMQGNLASQLQDGGMGGGRPTLARVSGEQIWVALNAFTRRSGKGEIVTWR